jgi:hypothetical protein
MRVVRIVRQVCSLCVPVVHATRLAAVVAVVRAIIAGGRVSVTAIGRAVVSRAYQKHSIKRVDRLLSNWRMQAERGLYFRALAHQLIGDYRRPTVLLDWTKVADNFHALVAAVPASGRALTIYAEVHSERDLGKARVHKTFLKRLRDVVPAGCRPIIVSDAGFHGPFFRAVRQLGWDFLGRIRANVTMKGAEGTWKHVRQLHARAKTVAQDLGEFLLYRTRTRVPARLVLIRARRRQKKHPWQGHRSGGGGVSHKTIRGAKEPWLLATSLADSANKVVELYRRRMQIEETFRDAKNPRFGWSLRHLRGYSALRLTVLLLLIAIAMLVATLFGLAAEARGLHRHFQANTERRRWLSIFVLGLALLHSHRRHRLRRVVSAGLARLRELQRSILSVPVPL